jgi:hypothetical protein
MASSHFPPDSSPDDTVRPDTGSWISGPSISFDEVPVADIRGGDKLLLDDGVIAEVGLVMSGDFWMHAGDYSNGMAIGWQEHGGSATGKLFLAPEDTLQRVRDGARVNRGPFETADEARELPEVRAIYGSLAPGGHLSDGARQLLRQALDDAGVSLGAYDRALTAWIAGFEPQVVAVIARWVTRAARSAR